LFDKFKKVSAATRLQEERLYELVSQELSSGIQRDGLWARAIADSGGNEEKAKAKYIKYRVQSLKDESTVFAPKFENGEVVPRNEREKRALAAINLLQSKGIKATKQSSGWLIKDVEGRRQRVHTLEELERSAKIRL
jgi:hypothetical protein